MRKIRLVPAVPFIIIGLLVLLAALAPLLGLADPTTPELASRFLPPFWMADGVGLGTDHLGRDVLSRIVYGARASLIVAAVVIVLSATFGSIVGIYVGFRGGAIDSIAMAIVDITLSLPVFLLAIVAAVVLGASATSLVAILVGLLWAHYARIARGETLSLKRREYIVAAHALGFRTHRILIRHLLPNLLHVVIVVGTLQLGTVILVEASLSFLGVGIPPPTPTWGRMIADGRDSLAFAWWAPVMAGTVLALVIVCVNLIGDWLRDRLDPQLTDEDTVIKF